MGMVRSPYSGKSAATVEKIRDGLSMWSPNTIYQSKQGWYWFENTKGYIHILSVICKKGKNGNVLHYSIEESMLTKEDTLKQLNVFGRYKSLNEAVSVIQGWFMAAH